MRYALALVLLAAAFTLTAPPPAHTNSGGGNARSAGVPGQNTCAQSGCHSTFALDSGSGSVAIASADAYVPGEPLELTVTVGQDQAASFGFQIAARDADNAPAGTFELADAGTRFSSSTSVGQQYVGHNAPSATGTWTVRWVPDATQQGDVTFYATGNAANGNGSSSGDRIYSTNRVVAMGQATSAPGSADLPAVHIEIAGAHPSARLELRVPGAGRGHLSVYDVRGRLCASTSLRQERAEVGGLAPGVYLVVAETSRGRASRTVVVR